jgi:hypothetical protein
MPEIRRANLPSALLAHLLARMRERNISYEQIVLLARWLDTEPEVPEGKCLHKVLRLHRVRRGRVHQNFPAAWPSAGRTRNSIELLP